MKPIHRSKRIHMYLYLKKDEKTLLKKNNRKGVILTRLKFTIYDFHIYTGHKHGEGNYFKSTPSVGVTILKIKITL